MVAGAGALLLGQISCQALIGLNDVMATMGVILLSCLSCDKPAWCCWFVTIGQPPFAIRRRTE